MNKGPGKIRIYVGQREMSSLSAKPDNEVQLLMVFLEPMHSVICEGVTRTRLIVSRTPYAKLYGA